MSSDLQGATSENMTTFANRYAERLKRGYAGFELTADMAQSGKTGLWEITFHCEVEGFAITQWITLSALNNSRALVTTAGAGREDFPALVNIFHNMRKSLNFS
ncbi:hypothetical protein J2D73_03655 [Acetobacter sacchari]|uniref:Uncharacterized protein n=1 Tax=Acetobacter sacchari TaxID=2661687 RepID=A0ABS3LSM8_9PROT|nr:hypothetical protein [Acetobacter sacchari]MBO1358896.1 hypothetical protein [Acetobacter sacchari]